MDVLQRISDLEIEIERHISQIFLLERDIDDLNLKIESIKYEIGTIQQLYNRAKKALDDLRSAQGNELVFPIGYPRYIGKNTCSDGLELADGMEVSVCREGEHEVSEGKIGHYNEHPILIVDGLPGFIFINKSHGVRIYP